MRFTSSLHLKILEDFVCCKQYKLPCLYDRLNQRLNLLLFCSYKFESGRAAASSILRGYLFSAGVWGFETYTFIIQFRKMVITAISHPCWNSCGACLWWAASYWHFAHHFRMFSCVGTVNYISKMWKHISSLSTLVPTRHQLCRRMQSPHLSGLKYLFGKSGHGILLTWIRTLIRIHSADNPEHCN